MSNASLPNNLHPMLARSAGHGASEQSTPRVLRFTDRQLTITVSCLLALSIVIIHRVNQRSYVGFHGLTHSAITFSVMEGNIPPTNPFAAELPLPYYWGYHVLLAQMVQLTGYTPVAMAEVVNVATIIALTVLFAAMGKWVLGSVRAGLLAVILILFAMNPFGPLLMAYRLFDGSLGLSVGEFTRSPTHPMLRGMFPNLDVRWAGTFFFHMQPSSRPLAMLAGAVTAALTCRSLAHVPLWRGGAIALATAIACAMQPIVGVGTALGLGTGLLFVRFANKKTCPLTNPVMLKLIVSMGVGVLLAFPTYQQLLNGDLVGLPIESSVSALLAKGFHVFVMLAIVPLVLTFVAYRRGYLKNPQLQMLAVGGVVLIVTSWITNVPGHREHSFFNMGTYLLALPAAAACGLGLKGRSDTEYNPVATRRCYRVLAWILPVAIIMVLSFGYRRPVALARNGELLRYPSRADAMAVYDWIAKNTPADAIIMFDTRDGEQISFYGVESEVPAMTRRFLFVDVVEWFIPANHPQIAARQEIVAAIFDGKPLTREQIELVQNLNRPLYALSREPSEEKTLLKNFGACAFQQGKYAIHEIQNLN